MSKRIVQVMILFSLLFFAAGCNVFYPTVKVGDETYRAVSEKERLLFLAIGKGFLKRNTPQIVTVEEYAYASKLEPELTIDYTGDRCGTARVMWDLPERKLTLIFSGPFFERGMLCMLEEEKKYDKLLDFRPKDDPSRYITPVFEDIVIPPKR
jgi:hypothetical protein